MEAGKKRLVTPYLVWMQEETADVDIKTRPYLGCPIHAVSSHERDFARKREPVSHPDNKILTSLSVQNVATQASSTITLQLTPVTNPPQKPCQPHITLSPSALETSPWRRSYPPPTKLEVEENQSEAIIVCKVLNKSPDQIHIKSRPKVSESKILRTL